MTAIFKRELRSYFTSPLGYVVFTVFALFEGFYFYVLFYNGMGDISVLFSFMLTISMFLCPILTMRLMSEDKRLKVDQALLTAPVSLWGVVMGKFLAAFTVFASCYLLTFVNQLIFAAFTTPNWIVYIGNLLGILLLGAALIAIGLFISSLTESQLVSAVVSFGAVMLLVMMDSLAAAINVEFVTKLISGLSFMTRQETFASGVLDFSNLIFFLSVAAVFLFLTVRMLEKKRWA